MARRSGSEQIRLVIGYDGSDHAEGAVREAGRLFPGGAAVVVFVCETGAPATPAFGGAPMLPPIAAVDSAAAASAVRAEEVSERGAQAAEAAGLEAAVGLTRSAQTSDIADVIIETAEAHLADAIVVGSRDRSSLKSAILGSVSGAVAQRSNVPVVIVPQGG